MGHCLRVLLCRMHYRADNRQQEHCCSSEEQYSLPQSLKKKTLVAQAVAATAVPEPLATINLPEGVAEPHSLQAPKLTIRQRQGRLFEELDLSGLESWPPELADSAQSLLAKYHDVFLLEPSEPTQPSM